MGAVTAGVTRVADGGVAAFPVLVGTGAVSEVAAAGAGTALRDPASTPTMAAGALILAYRDRFCIAVSRKVFPLFGPLQR
ncbi:hypothetical protein GCM10009803_01180 [Microbacterium ginsengiterrae]